MSSRFGTLLRKVRERVCLEQPHLAAYLHIDPETLNQIETGQQNPPRDALFYDHLHAVPGVTKADIRRLQKAAQVYLRHTNGGVSEIITKPLHKTHKTSWEDDVPLVKEEKNVLREGESPVSKQDVIPVRVEREVQSGEKPDQKKRAPKRQSRTHYDRDYLPAHAQDVVRFIPDALQSDNPDLRSAAEKTLQSLHTLAESVAKQEGKSISQVSRELGISISRLSEFVRKGLIPPLYKDRNTIYIANETTQELGRDKQDANEMGITLARVLRERHQKYFPEEPAKGVIFQQDRTPERHPPEQGTVQTYEVVATLEEAAEKMGLPVEELMTTREIQAEWNISPVRINQWTKRGPYGQPNLTPLPVRLGGTPGSSQLLFRREDVVSRVINPPKPGMPPRKSRNNA